VGACLHFAAVRLAAESYTLAVAAFNQRPITVPERAGFREVELYEHFTNGGLHRFVRMARGSIDSPRWTPALVLRHDEHYGAPLVVRIDLDQRPGVFTRAVCGPADHPVCRDRLGSGRMSESAQARRTSGPRQKSVAFRGAMRLASRVLPGYTGDVKTAISVPDDTFDEATKQASELGISRSEFFTRAARRYLEELASRSLTEQVNEALQAAGSDDSADAAVAAGRKLLAEDDW
jgi:hypothetical protein